MILKDGGVLSLRTKMSLLYRAVCFHEFIRGEYSEDSANDMSYILYMTDYTNFDHTTTIKVK